ncbi:MAG: hypothetical protein B7C55_09975 [Actinomycetales bacterium mxb001]|nr:MAG: hypothetical protein B7C55_09975 [Actinomycetales bacterium mxb001]
MTTAVAHTPRVLRPTTIKEATGALAVHPGARVVGGGTLVVAERSRGIDGPASYLLLSGIVDLSGVSRDGGGVRIGAQTTLRDLLDAEVSPLLDVALRSLATPQIRNRATVGGNIADRRPAHTLSPCFLALDAAVESAGAGGTRRRSMREFVSEGLAGGEIVVSVILPERSGFQRYTRVAPRNGPGYAIASVAVSIDPTARSVRTGLGGVGDSALAAPAADDFLTAAIDWDAQTTTDAAAAEYGRLLAEASNPVTDDRSTATYRRHAVTVMGRRLVEAWTEEQHHG